MGSSGASADSRIDFADSARSASDSRGRNARHGGGMRACHRRPARLLERRWARGRPASPGEVAVGADRPGDRRPLSGGRESRTQALPGGALRSGVPLPYPHYHDSRTIVVAINAEWIDARIRRRLLFLLENESNDPDLSVLVLTDEAPEIVAERLALAGEPHSERVSIVQVHGPGPANGSFPFLRDYAPVSRVVHTPNGIETRGFVLFRGSTLNKIVDRRLNVVHRRSRETVREKYALTEKLIDVYKDRIDHPVHVHRLELLMDGGNLITDGRGTCFFTRIFLDQNDRSHDAIEQELRDQVGCLRAIFLSAPQRLDFSQHVDTLLYFADSQNVVLSMPTLYESDLSAEFDNVETLLSLGYKVHRLPRKTASITYANILTTKKNVYVPQYSLYKVESDRQLAINERVRRLFQQGELERAAFLLSKPPMTAIVADDDEVESDNRRALQVIGRLFPDKRVVPAGSDDTIHNMESWHCLSHELPERSEAPRRRPPSVRG